MLIGLPIGQLTPVLRLTGMLRMLDWVDALSAYEKGGDYGGFAPLLRDEAAYGHFAEFPAFNPKCALAAAGCGRG